MKTGKIERYVESSLWEQTCDLWEKIWVAATVERQVFVTDYGFLSTRVLPPFPCCQIYNEICDECPLAKKKVCHKVDQVGVLVWEFVDVMRRIAEVGDINVIIEERKRAEDYCRKITDAFEEQYNLRSVRKE